MTKPQVSVPEGAAPTELQIIDLVEGDGEEAKAGHRAEVHYVGVDWKGKEFDSSWSRNDTLEFALGGGQVIKGWDQGVQGMKVGGRRQLVIPPHLAYGEQGAFPVIGPNETLIFVVDLVSVS